GVWPDATREVGAERLGGGHRSRSSRSAMGASIGSTARGAPSGDVSWESAAEIWDSSTPFSRDALGGGSLCGPCATPPADKLHTNTVHMGCRVVALATLHHRRNHGGQDEQEERFLLPRTTADATTREQENRAVPRNCPRTALLIGYPLGARNPLDRWRFCLPVRKLSGVPTLGSRASGPPQSRGW